jgi:sigma-B regulation protein RsbU (phosphoserine phosphatase)
MSVPLQPVTGMKTILGFSFWQNQLVLLALGLTVAALFWLINGTANLFQTLIFAFIIGNCIASSLLIASPLFRSRTLLLGLIIFLAVLIPVSAVASLLASTVWRLASGEGAVDLLRIDWADIRIGTFLSVITVGPMYLAARGRRRMEARHRELESQVTLGQIELKTHEAESRAAHEIQTHLLPREIPRVKGFDVACAWQPANSVSGDYFDVLALSPGHLAVCLADVSGKGFAAALLMANLQAAVRAFAPGIAGPGALCGKLNEVLCASVAPGKFVTLFYGVIDVKTLTLRFENAGHSSPIVLRGDSEIVLTDGGTVLGLFPRAEYEERRFSMLSGDCLLLTTDGVTEAANESDEEFGAERVTASARAVRNLGAHGMRTKILADVSRFCNGNFHDDASLIVVTVD